jgi:hypothetical protein
MIVALPALRTVLVLALAVPVLSGCGMLAGLFGPRAPEPGPTEIVYRAAMADFSDCATTTDPGTRAATAARLAQAAAGLQAETRPADPDHFFMADRVSAAARYCADAAR